MLTVWRFSASHQDAERGDFCEFCEKATDIPSGTYAVKMLFEDKEAIDAFLFHYNTNSEILSEVPEEFRGATILSPAFME